MSGSVGDTAPVAPVLTAALTASATSMTVGPLVQVAFFPFPASPASPVLIKVGDELMTYSAVTSGGVMTVTRGVNGTRAESHAVGAAVTILSGRPDGLFSDQIAATDILDMRHVVNPNGFDYAALLKGNLDKLLQGEAPSQLEADWIWPSRSVPALPGQDRRFGSFWRHASRCPGQHSADLLRCGVSATSSVHRSTRDWNVA